MNVFREMRPPDLFTLLNALLGFAAVITASLGEVRISVILILSATVADGLDGFLARGMGASSLGSNLDSLADLVSFGVAPAALVLTGFGLPWPAWALGGIYLACGMLRLARFNISSKNDLFFEGLPIPAAGIILAASVLLNRQELTICLLYTSDA
ncbi:MAG: CDP-diacylglycerol--serine O-phosphatidyltransferase, partial [Methanotrichaceae archaeon]|nr:CDP-diacylglycerol--serine O-phosphatidyltransferase [Methanotrichaceae archaeon]